MLLEYYLLSDYLVFYIQNKMLCFNNLMQHELLLQHKILF